MRFYSQEDLPERQYGEVVFRHARWTKLLATAICAGGVAFWACLGYSKASTYYIPAVLMMVFPLIFWQMFRKSLQPSNWLVRYGGQGLLVKYRSYLNTHFPAEDTIAFKLETTEIAWVGKTVERRTYVRSRGAAAKERIVYLDIKIARGYLTDLERGLEAERRVPGKTWYGASRAHDYPVRVIEGGTIRVQWSGITPRINKAIRILSQTLPVRPPEKTQADLTKLDADDAGLASQVRELVERGDMMGAIRLVREAKGCSLTQAKQYVERAQAG